MQTSPYTYLGPYAEFTKELPEDIEELCILQRMQIIHARELFFISIIRRVNQIEEALIAKGYESE